MDPVTTPIAARAEVADQEARVVVQSLTEMAAKLKMFDDPAAPLMAGLAAHLQSVRALSGEGKARSIDPAEVERIADAICKSLQGRMNSYAVASVEDALKRVGRGYLRKYLFGILVALLVAAGGGYLVRGAASR